MTEDQAENQSEEQAKRPTSSSLARLAIVELIVIVVLAGLLIGLNYRHVKLFAAHSKCKHQIDQKSIELDSLKFRYEQLIKAKDKKIKELKLDSILSPRERYHIKNKSLFPLMHEREVVFFTLLEGEMLRGIICDFSRYEITLKLKGGTPVTILRHAIYDLRDKKGRCFLKSFQETRRDWEKSSLYVSPP